MTLALFCAEEGGKGAFFPGETSEEREGNFGTQESVQRVCSGQMKNLSKIESSEVGERDLNEKQRGLASVSGSQRKTETHKCDAIVGAGDSVAMVESGGTGA